MTVDPVTVTSATSLKHVAELLGEFSFAYDDTKPLPAPKRDESRRPAERGRTLGT